MKAFLVLFLLSTALFVQAQDKKMINPIIKDYGGIYEIPNADEKVDPTLEYNIIVEVVRESAKPEELNWALNNVARMLNLHAMSGVPKDKLHVILAIHGGAAFTVMDNETYKKKYGVDNPNLDIYRELAEAGVKMVVCGQSVIARGIDRAKMVPGIGVADSMLTTMTTYQLRGYALLTF